MNEKSLIATETTSSRTTRYHPKFIGELLSKCNTKQMDTALQSLFDIGCQYQDKRFLDVRGRVLLTWANKIIANASCPSTTAESLTQGRNCDSASFCNDDDSKQPPQVFLRNV